MNPDVSFGPVLLLPGRDDEVMFDVEVITGNHEACAVFVSRVPAPDLLQV